MRVIGWTVAALIGAVFVIYAGNTALALVSSPDDGSVLLGVTILGVLVGAAIFGAMKGGEWLKRAGILVVLLMAVGCTSVPPGYVGIKVYQYGSQKGVEDFPTQTGMVWYFPPSTDVYSFPTYTQRVIYDKAGDVDESLTFRSAENASINADIGLTFSLMAAKVPHIFVTYRQDLAALEAGVIRDRVRNSFNHFAGGMKTMDILGSGQTLLLQQVTDDLRKQLEPNGIHIDTVSIVSKPRVDAAVEQAINQVIAAMQQANAAEQRVRQVQAEAQQAIARADGQAKSMLAVAEGEAEANRKITASLSDELIRYRALGKWNGQLPTVTGGATPLIQIK